MPVTLTTAEQQIRQTGMQQFGAETIANQVKPALAEVYASLRGNLDGWRARLAAIPTEARQTLALYAFAFELHKHGSLMLSNGATRYARLKTLDAATVAAAEQSAGYPAGFVAVAIKILDFHLGKLRDLTNSPTSSQLTTIFNDIEADLQALQNL